MKLLMLNTDEAATAYRLANNLRDGVYVKLWLNERQQRRFDLEVIATHEICQTMPQEEQKRLWQQFLLQRDKLQMWIRYPYLCSQYQQRTVWIIEWDHAIVYFYQDEFDY